MYTINELDIDHFDVSVEGHRLRVKKISHEDALGFSNRPALVFLHEGLGCIQMWKDFPEQLVAKTGLEAYVYDRRGFGHSEALQAPRDSRYLHDEGLHEVPEFLVECGIDKAILIGHSDGGTLALLAAAERPELVRGVITEAAHVFVEEETLAGIRATVQQYEQGELQHKLHRYHEDKTELLFRNWSELWLSDEFRDWNIEAYLPQIQAPLLVIQGEQDEYATSAQVDAIVRQAGGSARPCLLPDCGHTPHHQARQATLSAMVEFIQPLVADDE